MAGVKFLTTWAYTLGTRPGFIVAFLLRVVPPAPLLRGVPQLVLDTNALALVGYWLYPLAPPRLTDLGLEDPTKATLELGGALSWFQPFRNEFAAMPSMHVGYTFLFALTLVWLLRPSPWRWLALLWPATMLFVVVSTANHWILDGLGGSGPCSWRWRSCRRWPEPSRAPGSTRSCREGRDGHRVRLPGAGRRARARAQPQPELAARGHEVTVAHQPRALRHEAPGPGPRRREPVGARLPDAPDGRARCRSTATARSPG